LGVKKISKSELRRLQAMSVSEIRLKEMSFCKIAGIDEAGRGPLAGPVVAAACILPEGALFESLNDSKQLSAEQREVLFDQLIECPGLVYGVGIVDVATIDQVNILQATFIAMRKAVEALAVLPDYLLIDGNQTPHFDIPKEAIIEGDAKSISIAAASVLAKVTRDRIMHALDVEYPNYGFKKHKGYATAEHIKAIQTFGPSAIHRKSFDPVRTMLSSSQLLLIQDIE
jgi:ribonuclease HII